MRIRVFGRPGPAMSTAAASPMALHSTVPMRATTNVKIAALTVRGFWNAWR